MASKDRKAVREGLDNILGEDFVSQVVQGDRERAGRGAAPRSNKRDISEDYQTTDGPTSSTTDITTGSKVGSTTGTDPVDGEPATPQESQPQSGGSPLDGALRAMLAQPYDGDPRKGPYTVTSMKLQADVAERLGYAAALTKRPKQEIVSEALRQYFERLLEE